MAEDGGGGAAAGAVDEDAGAEEDAGVDCVVEGFGEEVVGGGVVVGPCFAGDQRGGGFFDVVEGEEGVEWWGACWRGGFV